MIKSNFPMVILAAFFFLTYGYGQQVEVSTDQSNQEMYDFHYEKYKKQKKTGFILLGSGVAVFLGGGLIGANNDLNFGAVAMTAGALTTISSIPIFIVSGSNKRKAQTYVHFTRDQMDNFGYSKSNLAAVGVKIEF